MHPSNSTTITFDERDKVKNWQPPGGLYNGVFKEADYDDDGRLVLKFEITSLEDPLYTYWVRHGFREKDRWKLNNYLLNWLGAAEYTTLIEKKSLKLSDLYEREADIEVGLLDLGKKDPLRVILNLAPIGSLLQIPKRESPVWEFEM